MTDSELKDECMENAEIDLGRYSYKELTQIREAMRMYADRKLKLFAIPDVVGRSEQLGCPKCNGDMTGDGSKSWCKNKNCDFVEAD